MAQAWMVMGETYLLTIVVSLFVAFLIHMMTLLIRRFKSETGINFSVPDPLPSAKGHRHDARE